MLYQISVTRIWRMTKTLGDWRRIILRSEVHISIGPQLKGEIIFLALRLLKSDGLP